MIVLPQIICLMTLSIGGRQQPCRRATGPVYLFTPWRRDNKHIHDSSVKTGETESTGKARLSLVAGNRLESGARHLRHAIDAV